MSDFPGSEEELFEEFFDEDDRPEQDFAASPHLHTHPVHGADMANAMARLKTDDQLVRDAFGYIETLRQVFGDKDEAVRRYADDLEGCLTAILAEMTKRPARAAVRAIRAQEAGRERDNAIMDMLTGGFECIPLISDPALRASLQVAADHYADTTIAQ